MDYKDILILVIAIPVIVSFIIAVWMIMFTMIEMVIEAVQDWRRRL